VLVFPAIWREIFGELCVGFAKIYQCSFLTKKSSFKQRILDSNNHKGKVSLIQMNGVQNKSIFEHNKTLGISYASHMLSPEGPFVTVVHTMLWEASSGP